MLSQASLQTTELAHKGLLKHSVITSLGNIFDQLGLPLGASTFPRVWLFGRKGVSS